MNLNEAQFEVKRRKKGEIKFATSSFKDPFIIKAVQLIAQHAKVSEQEVMAKLNEGLKKREDVLAKAPLLHGTMAKNAVENDVFTMFWELGVRVPGAP